MTATSYHHHGMTEPGHWHGDSVPERVHLEYWDSPNARQVGHRDHYEDTKPLAIEGPPAPTSTEVRSVDPDTGAEKGVKPERFDLVPPESLRELARVFGFGSTKYADRNWERGYSWGKSYAAMMRHLTAFWNGEDTDVESGLPHLAHAMWHCSVLLEFARTHPEKDDRP